MAKKLTKKREKKKERIARKGKKMAGKSETVETVVDEEVDRGTQF